MKSNELLNLKDQALSCLLALCDEVHKIIKARPLHQSLQVKAKRWMEDQQFQEQEIPGLMRLSDAAALLSYCETKVHGGLTVVVFESVLFGLG